MTPPTSHPGYFGPTGAECFGWLHLPAIDRADMGLVICSPFGHEDQSAYRSLRQLALEAAARGVPSLRFDPPSTGDSAGADGESDHPSAWRGAAIAAIETLRARSGVQRVCLVGVRTGVIAAALAAAGRTDVRAFVAIAPVDRGRDFLREAFLRSPNQPTDTKSGFETGGHLLSMQARAELGGIDLNGAERPPAPSMLLVSADDGSPPSRWQRRLVGQGVQVDNLHAPELSGMLQSDVTVLQGLVERLASWIADRAGSARLAVVAAQGATPLAASIDTGGVRETALRLRAGGDECFGILSEPVTGQARRGLLLVNTGSARRIGASRIHVSMARDGARAGLAVLRLDLPGLGDSDTPPGRSAGEAYAIDGTPAIAAACAALQAHHPGISCTLVGTCSGAYHALRAALAGVPIRSLVLINQAAYHWRQGLLDHPSLAMQLGARRYALGLGPAGAAAKTASHRASDVKWRLVAAWLALRGGLRELARRLGRPFPNDPGAALHALARRGMALHIVLSEFDDADPLLGLEAGHAVANLEARGLLQVERIAGADHIFTTQVTRWRLMATIARISRSSACEDPVLSPQGHPKIARSC